MSTPAQHRWHDAVIEALVASYATVRPPVYIEIGVAGCECFNQVAPRCRKAHAVDPSPHALDHVRDNIHGIARRWEMPSDQFFAEYRGAADVIFIDGDHHYEQAKRDFENAARVLAAGGTILIHDVWPGSYADTSPDACGDVYRLAEDLLYPGDPDELAHLRHDIPGWDCFLYRTFPGLLLCQRAEPLPTGEWAS